MKSQTLTGLSHPAAPRHTIFDADTGEAVTLQGGNTDPFRYLVYSHRASLQLCLPVQGLGRVVLPRQRAPADSGLDGSPSPSVSWGARPGNFLRLTFRICKGRVLTPPSWDIAEI